MCEIALRDTCIGMVGLGYVGLPAAIAFAEKYEVVGYDIQQEKIAELIRGIDQTGEVSHKSLLETTCTFTTNPASFHRCDVIIVAVPTPINEYNQPNLMYLKQATETIAHHLKKGATVVYESTVYPGATEEICIPILEEGTGLTIGREFSVGYSPERINPGDKRNTFKTIGKLVAGYNQETTDYLVTLYQSVLDAPVYAVPSIKIAEAAKIVENTQRDVNIAFMNELAQLFEKMDIDMYEVLAAASTKWNFIPFEPGLVGGHCISVDPYYLIAKAKQIDFLPELISTARATNANMDHYIVKKLVTFAEKMDRNIDELKVTVLGVTFKENVPDLRNAMAINIVQQLQRQGVSVQIVDPLADPEEVRHTCGEKVVALDNVCPSDIVMLMVPHQAFLEVKPSVYCDMLIGEQSILIDLKNRLAIKNWKHQPKYWTL